ncbi:MAG TPA: hypothetical protein VFC63_13520 [Blastocatellia bacterium]|nr:hypothetical protein [Blastocatellia bacterium]
MDVALLQKRFATIGARVKVADVALDRFRRVRIGIDISNDKLGEYFDIRRELGSSTSYEVIDVQPGIRHLLLISKGAGKFLCGHDERHWFVAAVPGTAITNVRTAMEALQPPEVRWAISRQMKRKKNRFARHNEVFVRQGEWFFIPRPDLVVKENLVFRNEPISRGNGSKPHMCQFVYRDGGVLVMVCDKHPRGLLMDHYFRLIRSNPKAANWNWRQMRANAAVYARGHVWHKDHKTIVLDVWHRVLINTENQTQAGRHVVFLD